jgi:hypothetical protein
MTHWRRGRKGRRADRIPIAALPRPGQDVMVRDPVFAQRRPGRPSLAPEEVLQRFLTAIRAGNLRKDAAAYAGLSEGTVKNWMMRGLGHNRGTNADRPPTPEYVRFARMVIEAEAAAKVLVTSNLVARSRVDTNAALAWLRTRYPEDWPTEPVAPEPAAAVPVVIDASDRRQQVVMLDATESADLIAQILAQRRASRAESEPPAQLAEEVPARGSRHPRLSALRVETDDRPG